MKKLSLIIVVLIVCQFTASAQPCLPDGITFNTQAEIDNFQTNHSNCTEIEGDVLIEGNDITNLNGLSVLTSIAGSVRIGDNINLSNYSLTSLTGLDNLTSIGGYLEIGRNTVLTSLTGLDNLTSIEGDLWIYDNDALISLTGLDNVISIGGDINIDGNNVLISLTGLDNVTSIGGSLNICLNLSLTSLSGLDNIDAACIDNLYLYHNTFLSTCEVQSVCDYLANPGGIIDIHGNAPGCNSQAEVEAACASVTVEEINIESEISLYPNPANYILNISSKDGATIEEVVIYNQIGQKVFEGELLNNTIDVSGLRQGMYIVEVVSKEWKVRKKLIVE